MPTLDEVRARLQGLKRQTKKQSNDIWKATGEHDIRVLPYPFGEGPFVNVYFHYNLGKVKQVLCPKLNFDENCAVCDFCDALRAWNDPTGKERPEAERRADFEIFKKIQPNPKVLVPMVERGKESEGAKYFVLNRRNQDVLFNLCKETDRLDALGISRTEDDASVLFGVFSNPDKAFDLHVTHIAPGKEGNEKGQYPNITVKGGIVPKPLTADRALREKLLTSVKNITDVYTKTESSEVKRIMDEFAANDSPEPAPTGGTKKYDGGKSSSPSPNEDEIPF